jgi:hypothetical protein
MELYKMTVTTSTQTQTSEITTPIVTDGAQPVVASPVVDGNPSPSPEPSAAPEPTPAASPEPSAAPEPSPTPTAKETPEWAQKRINKLVAERSAANRAAEAERDARLAAEARAAELLAQIANPDPNKPPVSTLTEEEVEKRAEEKAIQIARANEFNRACDAIADNGKTAFTDWDDALKNLSLVGVIGQGASPEFLETAIELKDPHKILHHLGRNLDEAERISKLPPKKMAMEMARIEATMNTPAAVVPTVPVVPPVSKAPAPVIPVGGAAKPAVLDINDPNLPVEDFMRLRAEAQIARKHRYQR